MIALRDLPLRHKLTLMLVFIVSVSLLLTTVASVVDDLWTTKSLMVNQFSTLANVLAANSAAALSVDPALSQQVLADLHVEPSIVFACTYDAAGNVAATYAATNHEQFRPPPPADDSHRFTTDGHLEVFKHVQFRGEIIGTVYLRATTHELQAQFRRSVLNAAVVLAVALGIALALSLLLRRIISDPISRLVNATQRVSKNSDFAVRVQKTGEDELGLLCDAFNSMLAQIQQRDAELEQHRLHLEELVRERTQIAELKTEELAQSNIELERSNVELQQFAFVASHDLQEPLRKIQAFGDLLQSKHAELIDDQARDYLRRMQNAAARMRSLIDGLLSYSRVRSKGQPFESVDLAAVAQSVVADLESRVQQSGGRVQIGELPTVDADAVQMRQLLQNLIGNALKFHRPGVPPVVQVSGRILENGGDRQLPGVNSDELLQLTVQDNGIGFDEKYVDRVFLPFQRLHGRDEYEGTGMGLAICRKIVERHSGTITAASIPGQGTCFIATLPMRQHQGEPAV